MKEYFTVWAQGRENAPPLVETALSAWEEEVGKLNLISIEEVRTHLGELGVSADKLSLAHQTDLVRLKIAYERGWTWVDATVIPMKGAAEWIDQLASQAGFFVFSRPGRDRLVATWLLASDAGNLLTKAWLEVLSNHYKRARFRYNHPLMKYGHVLWWVLAKRSPIWTVHPDKGGRAPFSPYFAAHYLFEHILTTNPEAKRIWDQVPCVSAMPCHLVQEQLKLAGSREEFLRLLPHTLDSSLIHKLSWKLDFPSGTLDILREKTKCSSL